MRALLALDLPFEDEVGDDALDLVDVRGHARRTEAALEHANVELCGGHAGGYVDLWVRKMHAKQEAREARRART